MYTASYGTLVRWILLLSLITISFGNSTYDDVYLPSSSTTTTDSPVDEQWNPEGKPTELSTKRLPFPSPFNLSSIPPVQSRDEQLRIHVMTMPAYGHYMTTRDIAVGLVLRGHHVTFIGCDRTKLDYDNDKLGSTTSSSSSTLRGSLTWQSAGDCPIYEHREQVIGQLIVNNSSPEIMVQMLESVAELSYQMCTILMPWYASLDRTQTLPHAIVFDADTYCAMDLSIRYRIPRVARVGTGLRDSYTNPTYTPSYSSGLTMDNLQFWSGRLLNTFLIRLNRYIISPILLPNLYGRHRRIWLNDTHDYVHRSTEYSLSSSLTYTVNENIFNPSLLWDGIPTLYNTHWGLEHSRPINPFEYLIGHTNDFLRSSQEPLPLPVDTWLLSTPRTMDKDSNTSIVVPVVYVGLGTLSIIPSTFLDTLVSAFTNPSSGYRFIWSVPRSQQQLLPFHLRQFTDQALCACDPTCTKVNKDSVKSSCGDYASAGTVLLVEWAPQVRTLLHPSTRYFITHGGMNGIAEATFARTPILCIPFFSDQPDNCGRAEDFGFGIRFKWNEITDQDILRALAIMSRSSSYDTAIQRTWIHNTAAGGILRAIQIIEQTANLPYGSYLSTIPRQYFLPWYQAYDIDMYAFAFLTVLILALLLRYGGGFLCCGCCYVCRSCCSCCAIPSPSSASAALRESPKLKRY